jgi:hypothetical protein
MKAYGEEDIYIHAFLTSALDGGEWSGSRSNALFPGKDSRHPLDTRLFEPQSRTGRYGEVSIIEIRARDFRVCNLFS